MVAQLQLQIDTFLDICQRQHLLEQRIDHQASDVFAMIAFFLWLWDEMLLHIVVDHRRGQHTVFFFSFL